MEVQIFDYFLNLILANLLNYQWLLFLLFDLDINIIFLNLLNYQVLLIQLLIIR